jgi:hypothetical protein
MPRRAKYTALPAEANEEIQAVRHRQQDDDFCRALLAAVYAGTESCEVGVSTKPGTKIPIFNYKPSD